jgi:hypothetical protein
MLRDVTSGDLQQHVTEEENSCGHSRRRRGQAERLVHAADDRKTDIHPIHVRDDVDHDRRGHNTYPTRRRNRRFRFRKRQWVRILIHQGNSISPFVSGSPVQESEFALRGNRNRILRWLVSHVVRT